MSEIKDRPISEQTPSPASDGLRYRVGRRARRVVDSRAFGAAVLASISGNALVLGVETYASVVRHWHLEIRALHDFFFLLFVLEAAVRASACVDRPRAYFRDRWNLFDLVLLILTVLPFTSGNTSVLRLLRLARIIRAARMLPYVRLIATTLGRSLPGASGFFVVGALVLYLYAMVGWMLFGHSDQEHYGSVGRAALTLFLLITLDGLSDMVREGLESTPWTIPYYVSFVLFASFILVNTLIGVVLNSLDEAKEIAAAEKTENAEKAQNGHGNGGTTAEECREATATTHRSSAAPQHATTTPVDAAVQGSPDLAKRVAELRTALSALERTVQAQRSTTPTDVDEHNDPHPGS